ncbi:MAG: SMI1/KNR4 family protein [Clostridiales bacterium]|nr:SMI1/KNR4 family protein [Clostridiales bacterium]
MSYQNFEKATELAKQCDGCFAGNGKPNTIISKASELLNIKFSRQNYKYFNEFGYLGFFGVEIFGIVKDTFSGSPETNCVETALVDRQDFNLPKDWLPIYFFDDGYMGYLDYSQLNKDGEPPVIMAIYNGEKYIVVEKVADDLGDFLLQLVEDQLSYQ